MFKGMTKFLIIRFSSIGDIIQCMDVVNGIRNRWADAEIHWLARADMASFLGMTPVTLSRLRRALREQQPEE